MRSLYYIGSKPRYIAEDDFPMVEEYEAPFDEPEPCDIAKQESLDDALLGIARTHLPDDDSWMLFRRQAGDRR